MLEEERPFLRPLPIEPFRYYEFANRTVHLDGCVEVGSAFYEAPALIGTLSSDPEASGRAVPSRVRTCGGARSP